MSIRILGINGSPRKANNSSIMLERALNGARQIEDVETQIYNFSGKVFGGCKASCTAYCMKNGKCSINDDLNDLFEKYMEADGIIWSVPVYHVGPPAQVKAALDRIGNVTFSYLKGKSPRFNKPSAALVQGSTRWGGQELTIQFFVESFLLMNCIPVTGDMPKSYFGVAGYAPTWENDSILEDTEALNVAENTGLRVAEMTKIVRTGINQLVNELPDIYFPKHIFEERKKKDPEISMNWQKED